MKFERYPSITNSYNIEDVIKFKEAVPDNVGWIVTEKIHGANFQFKSERPVSGEVFEPTVGKRSGFTDTNFFKLNSSESFLETFETIRTSMLHIYYTRPEVNSIEVDGEVYGGNIQKGIFYSRSKRFMAFDIKINDVFVDHKEYRSIVQEYNIPTVPIIHVGSLESCMEVSNTFNSFIPDLLNEDGPDTNICEGVVIKPLKTYHLSSGSRVILKNKNDLWSERASIKRSTKPLDGNDLLIYNLLSSMIDENRVESAISKFGSEMRLIPDILKEVNEDIIKSTGEPEYEKYLSDITVDISMDNTNKIRRLISKRIVNLIKKSIQGRML